MVHQEEKSGGLSMWATMKGAWNRYTRSELAGLTVAVATNVEVHAGIDNAAAVSKTSTLIEKANTYEDRDNTYPKKPIKKPFGLQGDGDLLEQFWILLEEGCKEHKGKQGQRPCDRRAHSRRQSPTGRQRRQ